MSDSQEPRVKETGIEILAVIPARAGSKRLPGKNLALLGNQPLITFTIAAARRSCATRVILSTDSQEIAAIGKDLGAEVPFIRPTRLAGDEASTLDVIIHTVRIVFESEGYRPEFVIVLPPTSPFRTFQHINDGISLLANTGVVSVIGVERVEQYHPYRMCYPNEDGNLTDLVQVENKSARSQTFPIFYCRNSSFYASQTSFFEATSFISDQCFDPRSVKPLVMDHLSSLDITNEMDLRIANAVLTAGLVRPG